MTHVLSKIVAAAALIGMAAIAHASSGALEINQACVEDGCFPGDAPGFPVTINATGSYVLTSNIVASGADAIQISANGVSLDLKGFEIRGQVSCSGSPAACTPDFNTNSYSGVFVSSEGVVVRNGSVRGFSIGIKVGKRGIVESVLAWQNSNWGISASEGSLLRQVRALSNGRIGIEIANGSEIVNSTAADNGFFGIAAGGTPTDGGATIRDSSVLRNGGDGIYDWGRSLIEGCFVSDTKGAGRGIRISNGGTLVRNSVITNNSGPGIVLDGGTAFEPIFVPVSLSGNSLTGNNGGSTNPQITGSGRIHLSPSLCGVAACP